MESMGHFQNHENTRIDNIVGAVYDSISLFIPHFRLTS